MQICFLIPYQSFDQITPELYCSTEVPHTVGDPDLQIRGGGGGGEVIQTMRFLDQFGLKIRGEPGPPGTSPRSTTAIDRGVFAIAIHDLYHVGNYSAKNFRSDLTNLLLVFT